MTGRQCENVVRNDAQYKLRSKHIVSSLIHLFYVMFNVSRRIQMGVESHARSLDRFAYLSIVTSLQ